MTSVIYMQGNGKKDHQVSLRYKAKRGTWSATADGVVAYGNTPDEALQELALHFRRNYKGGA